jgi:hypothetical protein
MREIALFASSKQGKAVKGCVTDDYVPLQEDAYFRIDRAPVWSEPNLLFINTVNGNIDRIEIVSRIYERFPGVVEDAVAKGRNSDLTDAGEIRIGRFHVNYHEAHGHTCWWLASALASRKGRKRKGMELIDTDSLMPARGETMRNKNQQLLHE